MLGWIERQKRIFLHFTPTSASWVNLVERFFATLTQKQIRRGVFTSLPHLEKCLRQYLNSYNDDPRPLVWTKTVDEIVEKSIALEQHCPKPLNYPFVLGRYTSSMHRINYDGRTPLRRGCYPCGVAGPTGSTPCGDARTAPWPRDWKMGRPEGSRPEMADVLLKWRPNIGDATDDVVSALMHSMERYSIESEGSGETGLRGLVFKLRDAIDERTMSF